MPVAVARIGEEALTDKWGEEGENHEENKVETNMLGRITILLRSLSIRSVPVEVPQHPSYLMMMSCCCGSSYGDQYIYSFVVIASSI